MVNNNPIEVNNKPDAVNDDNDDDNDGIYNPIDPSLTDSSDEQTLDEEEYLAAQDEINDQDEIKNLEKEKDMPLNELLALYNYEHHNINNNFESIKQKDDDINFERTVENLKLQDSSSESNLSVNSSHLQELLQPIAENGNPEDSVEHDPDFILEEKKGECKKSTIMVGKEYQVEIPEMICSTNDDAPYENNDELLWNPKGISDAEIVEYLRTATSCKNKSIEVKDDAQCLYALMQCDYNVAEMLRSKKENLSRNRNEIFDEITPFTDTECLAFEQGLTKFGKDFWKIQQHFVRTRTVKDLVHFYYLWKKTERHDAFVMKHRKQKKRYLINPGLTDYMDRFFRDPNHPLIKNKENCVKSIPGIINSEQTEAHDNDGITNKITRSKSKLNEKLHLL